MKVEKEEAIAGAAVGGGMALGIVVVAAAPIALGVTGFAAVKRFKKYKAKK